MSQRGVNALALNCHEGQTRTREETGKGQYEEGVIERRKMEAERQQRVRSFISTESRSHHTIVSR